jgi:hypothetical protein
MKKLIVVAVIIAIAAFAISRLAERGNESELAEAELPVT